MLLCEMKADRSADRTSVSLEGSGHVQCQVHVARDHLAEPDPDWYAPALLARSETRRPERPTPMLEARLRQDPYLFPSPGLCPMLP